jgi:ABC-type dipeptide/oligopeptide/nickel transport system permease component
LKEGIILEVVPGRRGSSSETTARMKLLQFVARRLLFAAPQIFGITLITFWLIRLLPGNPAYQLAGPYPTTEGIKAITAQLGLDQPVWEQYLKYLSHLAHGDFGVSWFSTSPVSDELRQRLPATLELISIASFFIVVGGIVAGVIVAVSRRPFLDKLIDLYGLLSGAFPDFWLGLVLTFLFFFSLGWLPAPLGRLDVSVSPPPHVTGFYTVDSLVSGDWSAFRSAVAHLVLPVATLVIVYMAAIVKMTRSTVEEMLRSDMITYARACGLPDRIVLRYALRNSLPPIVTLIGLTYGYLLGGAVLVEKVFSWGGLGSYVVDSVLRSDYFPVQAFVLIAAVFNFGVYLVVDLVHLAVDPRVEY